MARKRPGEPKQIHPEGGLVTLTDEIRSMLKQKRLENGWSQREMGSMIGITGGAISGIETGATDQIHKTVLAKYFRVFGESRRTPREQPVNSNVATQIAAGLLDLQPTDQQIVLDLVERLKKRA